MSVNFGNLNHGGCATPAISGSIAFFDAFYLPSATTQIGAVTVQNLIYPNPGHDLLTINQEYGEIRDLTLFDTYGNQVISYRGSDQVRVDHLPSGVYLARARLGDAYIQQKVVLIH